jgi:hypothetical protein
MARVVRMRFGRLAIGLTLVYALTLVVSITAQQGAVVTSPATPPELPLEIETELSPAASLKQAPLWHELAQILENPSLVECPADDPDTFDDESKYCIANIERRQSFGTVMPPLRVWNPCFNVLTGEPLRYQITDEGLVGEISWDKPGILFDEDDGDVSTPLDEVIGRLIVDDQNRLVVADRAEGVEDDELPPNGTIVAIPACNDEGESLDDEGEEIEEFELPISELDFLRDDDSTAGVPTPLVPYIGRQAAQVLGKALFWDMQVGSDGVQACGSCHFHAGVDNRTKNQLNPNHLGGDQTLQVHAFPNQDLVASDYPFRRLANLDGPSEGPGATVVRDSNDVMSSMGVKFRKFGNIPRPGGGTDSNAFLHHTSTGGSLPGVRPLAPDCQVPDGPVPTSNPSSPSYNPVLHHCDDAELPPQDPTAAIDPIPLFQGFRRVEPRNTPTIFGTAFFFDQFWDGRARHDANGGSPFGAADPQFHVFINNGSASNRPRGATNGDFRDELLIEDPEVAEQPVRIRFSSLASLATGPALSDFEMSFAGRNWQKLGKKLLQEGVTPLANQLVDPNDSVLGPFSNQRSAVGGPVTSPGRPGLNVTYRQLIRAAFPRELHANTQHYVQGQVAICTSAVNGVLSPAGCDPFDGYALGPFMSGVAEPSHTDSFNQMEANFSLFFGLSVQLWQQLLLPDDTPFDRFMDANPNAGFGVSQPGEQNTLPPSQVPAVVGPLTFPDPELFGPDELFGFDIFAGANLTAALPRNTRRNPAGVGSNPFFRTARCALCHFGPEQSDHTNNINAGLLLSDTEFEFPNQVVLGTLVGPEDSAIESTGPFRIVTGIALAEEVEENAQDGVELELRNFTTIDDPSTPDIDERVIAFPGAFSFQDNGVYNIGVRPTDEDIMRGANDAFGFPLSLAALALKNLSGADYEPCDTPAEVPGVDCTGPLPNFDPSAEGFGLFEETDADQRINPGLEMAPADPLLPEYLAPWANNLSAGELHPQIDELSVSPNTITFPNAGPTIEFGEILFGADTNCGTYDPDQFGAGPPTYGWGPLCPNAQSAIPNNMDVPLNGTWPFANRVARDGHVKVPQLRNVELTGPYFHTGSYLTLRQVVDFYMRGGDFPLTNAENRDPNLVDVNRQAFGFGATNNAADMPPELQDGFPDSISQYGAMPDTNPTNMDSYTGTPTPEYATAEDAKVSIVKLLISMTDQRVKFERAPFDHPEIFVPLDGTAPDNGSLPGARPGGRQGFLNNLANGLFKHINAVGAGGNATPLPGFLGVTTNPAANCVSEISHFCR